MNGLLNWMLALDYTIPEPALEMLFIQGQAFASMTGLLLE